MAAHADHARSRFGLEYCDRIAGDAAAIWSVAPTPLLFAAPAPFLLYREMIAATPAEPATRQMAAIRVIPEYARGRPAGRRYASDGARPSTAGDAALRLTAPTDGNSPAVTAMSCRPAGCLQSRGLRKLYRWVKMRVW